MSSTSFEVFWTHNAKEDLKNIYVSLKGNISKEVARKIREELFNSSDLITFPEQFQLDEYRSDCRRLIVRDYKILYQFKDDSIFIIRVFNTLQDPSKSMR
ncbi:type II toxin-antitoxin system RelE/ParE family toxin [Flavobacterium sp. W1B]|uniref:type II toxin-antitoxin system RelE/ParE family toxin n=1 Tax=Flavobacterium sp. W1B TaxID=3394146 RepID=UPI0039BC81FA